MKAAQVVCWIWLAALLLFTTSSHAEISDKEVGKLVGTWKGSCKQKWFFAPTNNLEKKWTFPFEYGGKPICTETAFEYQYTLKIRDSEYVIFEKSVSNTKFMVGSKQYAFPNQKALDTKTRAGKTYYKYGFDGYKNGWFCTNNSDDSENEWGFKLAMENGKQVYYESSVMVTGGTGETCATTTKITCNADVVPTWQDKGEHVFGTTVCKLYKIK